PVPVLRAAFHYGRAVARSHPPVLPGRQGHLEQRRHRLPPLQQCEGLAHARAGEDAADRRAVHAYLRGIHLPEGPARAGRPDAVPAGALPAQQPAARAHPRLDELNRAPGGAGCGTIPRVVFLIDASVYVFRAYYSMPPTLCDPEGNPVHAVFGFARFLGDLIERAKPEYLAVAFDASLT